MGPVEAALAVGSVAAHAVFLKKDLAGQRGLGRGEMWQQKQQKSRDAKVHGRSNTQRGHKVPAGRAKFA
ncbi:MAG: hypothetical protein NVS3B25_20220 [Hymenobacter sp.]